MSRHDDTRVRDALEAWAATLLCGVGGLGWPSCTTLGRILEEGRVGAAIRPAPGSRVPRTALDWRYWAVQRVLLDLGPEHWVVACAESGLLNGHIRPQDGIAQRAKVITDGFGFELSPHTYKRRLKALRRHLGWELDRMAERRAFRAYGWAS